VPVVGEHAFLGCLYAEGTPACSRYVPRIQIYDPAQYAEVIATTRQPYDVKYIEEADFSSVISQFGSPTSGAGMPSSLSPVAAKSPVAVMPDPDHHQVMIAINNAKLSGAFATAVYILNVSQVVPHPILPLVNLGMALMGLFSGRSVLLSFRRQEA
jgi:hypothetical protein